MGTKTKVQLEQEIAELKAHMDEQGKAENNAKAAKEMYGLYESYTKAGFSTEQAWELMRILVLNGTKPRGLFGNL